MYEIERSADKIRVVQSVTGAVVVELNSNTIVVIETDNDRTAVQASAITDVDLVNALIKAGRI